MELGSGPGAEQSKNVEDTLIIQTRCGLPSCRHENYITRTMEMIRELPFCVLAKVMLH